jgi:hypothetical protein
MHPVARNTRHCRRKDKAAKESPSCR